MLVILLFRMVPKWSGEVLSSVPAEKVLGLGKFCSGTSGSAVRREFSVNESQYIVSKVSLNIKQGYILISQRQCCDLRLTGP